MSGSLVQRLARWRVPLGFASAAACLVLARPSLPTLVAGATVAALGEALRIWASGHLEKSREVTSSGPYRFMRHPLYVGSSIMGVGLALAGRSWVLAALVGVYLGVTLSAAIRTEEAFLRDRFGPGYDAYAAGRGRAATRPFSWARAARNREYRALIGLSVIIGLLAAKACW